MKPVAAALVAPKTERPSESVDAMIKEMLTMRRSPSAIDTLKRAREAVRKLVHEDDVAGPSDTRLWASDQPTSFVQISATTSPTRLMPGPNFAARSAALRSDEGRMGLVRFPFSKPPPEGMLATASGR